MSYAGFVADVNARHPSARVRFAVEIYGLPYILTSDTFDSTVFASMFGAYRTQLRCLLAGSVRTGQRRLDVDQRRVTSSTAEFSILQDAGGIVASLITPRAKPIARVKEAITLAETDITCTLDTRTVSNTPVYIGNETMRATAWSGGVITVARGQYGTDAQLHFGGSDGAGNDIYASPQSWANRSVKIWAYLLDDNGSAPSSSAYYGSVYAGKLAAPPSFADGIYTFAVEHIADKIENTECGLGLREIKLQPSLQVENFDTDRDKFYLPATDLALFGAVSTEFSCVIVSGDDESVPCRIVSVGADHVELSNRIAARDEIYARPLDGAQDFGDTRGALFPWRAKSIRHAVRLRGDPAEIALMLATSNLGDQNEFNADVLPGTTRTIYGGQQFRFGAGLTGDNIDQEVYEALMGRSPVQWDVLIDRPIKHGQVMQELCAALGLVRHVDDDGFLNFFTMSDREYATPSTLSITKEDTVISPMPSVRIEQGPALSSVTYRGAWDALIGKHLATVESVDWELVNAYGEAADSVSVDANFSSVNVAGVVNESHLRGALRRNGGADISTVETLTRRIQKESTATRQIVSVTLPLKFLSVAIGDVVTYTDDRLPDGAGGTLDGALMRCVGREVDWTRGGGVVALALMLTRPGWRYAPSALITANSGGATPTLTLSTSWDSETSPGLNFPTDCNVYVHNCTTGTGESVTVLSQTSTTVTVQGPFSSFTFTSGVCFVWYNDDGMANSPTPDGYTEDDFAKLCDEDANDGDSAYSEWG